MTYFLFLKPIYAPTVYIAVKVKVSLEHALKAQRGE
jgi:hypothetical protein